MPRMFTERKNESDPMISTRILHHGNCTKEFEPKYVGTDYFTFKHKPCTDKPPFYGNAQITHVLIDHQGRIIFNLKCRTCGAVDVLKTAPYLWIPERPKPLIYTKIFHFSPKLKQCVRKHWWDNL